MTKEKLKFTEDNSCLLLRQLNGEVRAFFIGKQIVGISRRTYFRDDNGQFSGFLYDIIVGNSKLDAEGSILNFEIIDEIKNFHLQETEEADSNIYFFSRNSGVDLAFAKVKGDSIVLNDDKEYEARYEFFNGSFEKGYAFGVTDKQHKVTVRYYEKENSVDFQLGKGNNLSGEKLEKIKDKLTQIVVAYSIRRISSKISETF